MPTVKKQNRNNGITRHTERQKRKLSCQEQEHHEQQSFCIVVNPRELKQFSEKDKERRWHAWCIKAFTLTPFGSQIQIIVAVSRFTFSRELKRLTERSHMMNSSLKLSLFLHVIWTIENMNDICLMRLTWQRLEVWSHWGHCLCLSRWGYRFKPVPKRKALWQVENWWNLDSMPPWWKKWWKKTESWRERDRPLPLIYHALALKLTMLLTFLRA